MSVFSLSVQYLKIYNSIVHKFNSNNLPLIVIILLGVPIISNRLLILFKVM